MAGRHAFRGLGHKEDRVNNWSQARTSIVAAISVDLQFLLLLFSDHKWAGTIAPAQKRAQ